jgi:acetylornithine deacetylase/succinyl-diaminopimelate desuccinylase-like protein
MRHEEKGTPAPPPLKRVWDQIDADFDSHIERIRTYLRQPTIASTGEGVEAGANMTAEFVTSVGGTVDVVPTSGSPVILGRIGDGGPTLLRYGMYDVQPADEPAWTSPPFGAEIRTIEPVGPCIVARGAANSKGSLAAFFLAIESIRRVDDLPVTILLLLDGEEEAGSPSLAPVVESHRDALKAEAAFDLDLTADMNGVPAVSLGCKGIVSFTLECAGGEWGGPSERALHSSEGGIIASPAWSLTRALSALVGPDESVVIDGVVAQPVPVEDSKLVDALIDQTDVDEWLKYAGASRFKVAPDRRTLIETLLYAPALNINGLDGGYAAGGKTIIPHRASAVLDLRVPPGVDPQAALESVRKRVAQVAPEVRIKDIDVLPGARTPSTATVAQAMIASHADAGAPAHIYPVAPWWAPYYLFEDMLGLPFAVGGAGVSGRAHASDEYASIEGLRSHMKQAAAFLYRVPSEGD